MKRIIFLFLFAYSNIISNAQDLSTIAVLNLRAKGLTNNEADILTDKIRSVLVNFKKYTVVDRTDMEDILKEQGFQFSGCTSDDCVVEAGKILGVKKMISGSVGKFGKIYILELKMINVESLQIESSAIYESEGKQENLLNEGVNIVIDNLVYGNLSNEKDEADISIEVFQKGYNKILHITREYFNIEMSYPSIWSYNDSTISFISNFSKNVGFSIPIKKELGFSPTDNDIKEIISNVVFPSVINTNTYLISEEKVILNNYETSILEFESNLNGDPTRLFYYIIHKEDKLIIIVFYVSVLKYEKKLLPIRSMKFKRLFNIMVESIRIEKN